MLVGKPLLYHHESVPLLLSIGNIFTTLLVVVMMPELLLLVMSIDLIQSWF